MQTRWIALALSLCAFKSLAQSPIENPKSCFRGPFESHQKWVAFLASKKPRFNKDAFLKVFPEDRFNQLKDTVECVDFTYQVDGLTVEGYYLQPKNTGDKKLPLVIYNRGGNAGFGYVVFGKKMQLIADIAMAGYTVVGSQYRGSSRSYIANNGEDEFGGADVNDVVALAEIAKTIPNTDTDNLALVGWSRGAMQSYRAARELPQTKAIIAIAGNADAEKGLEWRPAMERVYRERVPDFTTNREAALTKRSVIKWIDELPAQSHILLLHGTEDKRVNVEQSKELGSALARREHPYKLAIFEGDNHALFNHREQVKTLVLDWLAEYLPR